MKPLTLADRVYIARYYETDGPRLMGALFGKSHQSIVQTVETMKNNGEFKLYRSLTDEEYEKILKCAEERDAAKDGETRTSKNSR